MYGTRSYAGGGFKQVKDLQTRQIFVPTHGWTPEEMARAAKRFGFQAVNAPIGNDIQTKAAEAKVWSDAGFKMIVRPAVPVSDPFDFEDIKRGCEQLRVLIEYYDKNPDVVGFSLCWGQYGEGGFPPGFSFSEKAKEAFNKAMGTPGEPLPDCPSDGIPGSLRWVEWHEFRSRILMEFRKQYVQSAKKATRKPVGTWSEFYPTENYNLNMGDAPGADFLMYDLSFGDATVDQTRAFGECHGDMQHYRTFEEWRNHELPLMAKAAGEGVVPIAFQFPMRRGHAEDTSENTVTIDNIEDEYALRIGPDIRKLIDAIPNCVRKPEVALVYNSFAATALPAGKAFAFYQQSARFIEGMLHQMGVDLKVIPYEHLESANLDAYRLVIVPEPMYLNEAMRANLKKARKVLYAGEYLLTHHDPSTAGGNFNTAWSGITRWENGTLRYNMAPVGQIKITKENPLMKEVVFAADKIYPADQTVTFDPLPPDAEVLMWIGDTPAIITMKGGRVIHVTNRFFIHAYREDDDWLEKGAFTFLRNLVLSSGANVRVGNSALARVKEGFPYGSYGITGRIAWNTTGRELTLRLSNGRSITIPRFGWMRIP